MATYEIARRRMGNAPLLIVVLTLLAALSSALDLSKAFGGRKNNQGDDPVGVVTDADAAIANAKKLVEDMNDAATGTVTSYQPGREKEPVTCNDIMAKALVVANEEKAAVIEERDSVVKAASLLSDRIDDLEKKLEAAYDHIETLKGEMDEESVKAEEKLQEQAKQSNEHLRMLAEDATNAQTKAADAIAMEREQSKLNMEKLRNSTDAKIASIKEDCYNQVLAAEKDRNLTVNMAEKRIKDADDEAEEKVNKAREEADALVKQAEKRVKDAEDAAEMKVIKATEESNALVKQAEDRAEAKIAEAMNNMREQSILFEQKFKEIKQTTADEIRQAHSDAEAKILALSEKFEADLAEMKEKAAADIKRAHADAESRVKQAHIELDNAVASAEARIKSEKEEKQNMKLMFEEAIKEASEKQKALMLEVEQAKTSSSDLQNEVTFWKQTHESQSYCNMTLMRQDSGKIVMRGVKSARDGLEIGQEFLMDLFDKQLAAVQRVGGEMVLFIEQKMIPSFLLIVHNGRVKAIALYDEHLAEVVNKNVIPVYNQHIYPVYNQHIQPAYEQHVAPIVKTIEKEATVAIEKSQKEAQKARSSAASLVKQSSSSAIKLIEEKEADSIIPSWVMARLEQSSKDGERVVDALCKGLLILVVILCRSLIYRIIGSFFALIWFFCPLRIFFRQRGDVSQDSAFNGAKAKPPQDKVTNGTKSGPPIAGKKVKMY